MTSFSLYRELIKNIPIDEQAAYADRHFWKSKIAGVRSLRLSRTIGYPDKLVITRQNLLDRDTFTINGILHVLIWGYPSGGRGDNIDNCITNISNIRSALLKLNKSVNPNVVQLKDFYKSCGDIHGLGISTWSKLLYFNQIRIGDHDCNIYDNVVKEALKKLCINLEEYADPKLKPKPFRDYMAYLKFLSEQAGEIDARTDQVEYFLFSFGSTFELNLNPE